MDKDAREEYWNDDYFSYWKKRVAESEEKSIRSSGIVYEDFVVPSDRVYESIFEEINIQNGKILDVGCAWGRMFSFYAKRSLKIYGVDISEKMVHEAEKHATLFNAEVKQAKAEVIPYPDDYFDYLACLGVFDATFQNMALSEFMRVVKPGGKIIITGKNNRYYKNDFEAKAAEIGAIKKGEPNYFTDVKDMTSQIIANGQQIIKCLYFKRRGDFSISKYVEEIPERFYEYCIVIGKKNSNYNFGKFSYVNSNS